MGQDSSQTAQEVDNQQAVQAQIETAKWNWSAWSTYYCNTINSILTKHLFFYELNLNHGILPHRQILIRGNAVKILQNRQMSNDSPFMF